MYTSSFHSPLGYMRACSNEIGLYRLDWQQIPFIKADQENDVSRETIRQVKHYFNSQLSDFRVPLDLSSHSPALVKWFTVLATVSFGDVITYKELAQKWGNVKAARAAGQACRRNPLPIILPCHRIVQTKGKFDNYSGGDKTNPRDPKNIYRKQWLINFESRLI